MPIIVTWGNDGSALAAHVDERGVSIPAAQFEIEGSLAQRTGQALIDAIVTEARLSPDAPITIVGTDLLIGGVVRATLADSVNGVDKPFNAWFAQHLRSLVKNAPGDRRTLVWMIAKMLARYARWEWGLSKTAFQTAMGRAYDAATNANSDGD